MLIDIKGKIENNTKVKGDFNTPFTLIDRSSRQEINKAQVALNNTREQMDLIDSYRTFNPKTAEYILFKGTWNILKDRSHDGPQNMSQQI